MNASTQVYDTPMKSFCVFPKTCFLSDAIESTHEENNIIYISWLENCHTFKDSDQ